MREPIAQTLHFLDRPRHFGFAALEKYLRRKFFARAAGSIVFGIS